jgi:ABC-type molybdenum transport system ATPase subunit/photorepair protein PhrA
MVLIAAAVAEGPRVLIVDEPCTGLDADNRARVLGLFEALGGAQLTSLIYITHHPEEVLPCISHVLHLQGGAVAYSGRVEGYRPPATRP